ncbi:hypothetical protein [Nocardia sp. NPDC051570]|uniref:hypothetical protein n=1 Tax=Nocardia sp. NPDC051570 TaxID=3364324 RepID=UPI0037A6BB18
MGIPRSAAALAVGTAAMLLSCPAAVADPTPFGSGSAMPEISTGSASAELPLDLHPPAAQPVRIPTRHERRAVDEELAIPAPAPGNGSVAEGSGVPPSPDSGSVQTACAGSAIVGGTALLLGLLTGSGGSHGVLGFGSVGPGSSLGSVVTGSGGSALGSAAVGSAVTGSALLTCLLLVPGVPPPPAPESPLQLSPPPPPVPNVPVPPTVVVPVATPIPVPPPEPTPPVAPQPPRYRAAERAPLSMAPVVGWNPLRLMTVLIISVLAVAGSKAFRRRR